MRKLAAIPAAAVLAAAFFFILFLLPPRRAQLPAPAWQPAKPSVAGVLHVHTNRSDGSGTPDDVAAAAARAGLNFIILTDHGDATRAPDPPQYRSGVLCIDAVEISTDQGHYIALGLAPAPYPLGGEPRDVVEDVTRLGGFGIAAHPDSRKPGLRWNEWTAPFEGVEWLNADSEWRDEGRRQLLRALLTYPFRPVETIASLLSRPDTTLLRWNALTQRRKVVGVAGSDAHARLGRQNDDSHGYGAGSFVRLPSYEASFRAFSLRVSLEHPFEGNAEADAALLLRAIRAGHLHTVIDAIGSPSVLEFTAASDQETAGEGDQLEPRGAMTFSARANGAMGGVIVLRKDGTTVQEHALPELTFKTPQAIGAYRIEVYLPAQGQRPMPWIVSNPIYLEPAGWGRPFAIRPAASTDSWNIQGGPWHVEHDPMSTGGFVQLNARDSKGPVEFSYRLASGTRAGQYSALVMSAGNALTGHNRLAFHASASKPMRISVQARRPAGERWQRSVYLDPTPRDVTILFAEMMPVGENARFRFEPREIDTILFVADTAHTAPGGSGSFTLGDLSVEH